MKRIFLIIFMLLMLSAAVAEASSLEEANKLTDEEKEKIIADMDYDEYNSFDFYKAYTMESRLYTFEGKISDYFNKDINACYAGENDDFCLKGVDQNYNRVFSNIQYDGGDNAIKLLRSDKLRNADKMEEAVPVLLLSDNSFITAVLWVRYKDGTEKIIANIEYDKGDFLYAEYTGEEYANKDLIYKFKPYGTFTEFSDCSNAKITFLKRIRLIDGYDDGTYRPDALLTRAEAVKIICSVCFPGVAEQIEDTNILFSDMPKDYWAIKYINYAVDRSIVNGFDDKTFRPEEYVTEIQFATMLLNALGYESRSLALGGYPDGYAAVAKEKGIADAAADTPANRLTAGEMLYNFLDVNVMITSGYMMDSNVGELALSMKTGEAALVQFCSIQKVNGILTVDKLTNIGSISKNNSKSTELFMGYDDADKFSGKSYTHYVMMDENGNRIWLCAK